MFKISQLGILLFGLFLLFGSLFVRLFISLWRLSYFLVKFLCFIRIGEVIAISIKEIRIGLGILYLLIIMGYKCWEYISAWTFRFRFTFSHMLKEI